MPKIGDVVLCMDDCSDDLDFGMSGIVLNGRNDLKRYQKYTISEVLPSERYLPKNNRNSSEEEFGEIYWGWHKVYLNGITNSVFLHHFKRL